MVSSTGLAVALINQMHHVDIRAPRKTKARFEDNAGFLAKVGNDPVLNCTGPTLIWDLARVSGAGPQAAFWPPIFSLISPVITTNAAPPNAPAANWPTRVPKSNPSGPT